MGSLDETILRTSKEIVVKFIEMGRISPVTFSENFKNVYNTVDHTVKSRQQVPVKHDLQAETNQSVSTGKKPGKRK